MKKKSIVFSMLLGCFLTMGAFFSSYTYVTPEDFKQWLDTDKPLIIVDIQDKEAFAKQHFQGSIETNAYPVENDAERARIEPAVEKFKATNNDVVIVCPRGKGGAERCYDYMKSQGVPIEKMFILEKGIDKWPYREMVENQN
ncbi:MAG: rhodanese-like domain-containing protein [Desulfopila sp.]